ncbi:hypothetical protein KASIA_p119 [Shewanella phage vB_SspS_KASIA]|nr:hypothetical protein KASIA_p119 [Shewanella phage vB_SspS_KASIA]
MNSTEKDMVKAIYGSRSRLCTSYQIGIPNCYTTYDNEADLFFIRKSGFCDEVEIKVSRSDLLADKKKRVNYREAVDGEWYWKMNGAEFAPYSKEKHIALKDGDLHCNYFWYALKEGIGGLGDIPTFAGLINIHENGRVAVIRQPARLHTNKLDADKKYQLALKCGYRFWKSEFGIS